MMDNSILQFQTGSHAYGLNTPQSDLDSVGVFVIPLRKLVSPFSKPKETVSTQSDKQDIAYHDVGKFVRLAAGGNPNILETLWCPVLYKNQHGQALLDVREKFLSQRGITAYLGYYTSQRQKLEKGKSLHSKGGTWNSKYACHMIRLLLAAEQLATEQTVMVRPPEGWRRALLQIKHNEMTKAEVITLANALYKRAQAAEETTCLPKDISQADRDEITDLVLSIRKAY